MKNNEEFWLWLQLGWNYYLGVGVDIFLWIFLICFGLILLPIALPLALLCFSVGWIASKLGYKE